LQPSPHRQAVPLDKSYCGAGTLPTNQWIGYKLAVYDLADGGVKQGLWADETDGQNGGTWRKLNEHVDYGLDFGVGGSACAAGTVRKLIAEADAASRW
jgi:hypothetical protein